MDAQGMGMRKKSEIKKRLGSIHRIGPVIKPRDMFSALLSYFMGFKPFFEVRHQHFLS
jgi:hypothetical protein